MNGDGSLCFYSQWFWLGSVSHGFAVALNPAVSSTAMAFCPVGGYAAVIEEPQ